MFIIFDALSKARCVLWAPTNFAAASAAAEEGEPALRLRFSVSFKSEHARMLGYMRPLPLLTPPPHHDLALGSPRALSESKGIKCALLWPLE